MSPCRYTYAAMRNRTCSKHGPSSRNGYDKPGPKTTACATDPVGFAALSSTP
jgi:hypothetical protein